MTDFNKYHRLKQHLENNEKWPLYYMFKFIVPNEGSRVEIIKTLLPQHGEVSYRHTKNLKYVAITCKAWISDADIIIDITKKAEEVEGVMSL